MQHCGRLRRTQHRRTDLAVQQVPLRLHFWRRGRWEDPPEIVCDGRRNIAGGQVLAEVRDVGDQAVDAVGTAPERQRWNQESESAELGPHGDSGTSRSCRAMARWSAGRCDSRTAARNAAPTSGCRSRSRRPDPAAQPCRDPGRTSAAAAPGRRRSGALPWHLWLRRPAPSIRSSDSTRPLRPARDRGPPVRRRRPGR
jgi:hypothetical protein